MPKVSEAGKTAKFDNSGYEILNKDKKVVAFATRVGNLYYLEFCQKLQQLNVVQKESKERLWHCRYGHLCEQSLRKMVRKKTSRAT